MTTRAGSPPSRPKCDQSTVGQQPPCDYAGCSGGPFGDRFSCVSAGGSFDCWHGVSDGKCKGLPDGGRCVRAWVCTWVLGCGVGGWVGAWVQRKGGCVADWLVLADWLSDWVNEDQEGVNIA